MTTVASGGTIFQPRLVLQVQDIDDRITFGYDVRVRDQAHRVAAEGVACPRLRLRPRLRSRPRLRLRLNVDVDVVVNVVAVVLVSVDAPTGQGERSTPGERRHRKSQLRIPGH